MPCCVRGYHVYQAIWAAAIGEELLCEREPTNAFDRYAVAVVRSSTIIGHLPRRISKICSLLLRRGGSIYVSGSRRYSADLPQGGLEIPCNLTFKAKVKEIKKVRTMLETLTPIFEMSSCCFIQSNRNNAITEIIIINHCRWTRILSPYHLCLSHFQIHHHLI